MMTQIYIALLKVLKDSLQESKKQRKRYKTDKNRSVKYVKNKREQTAMAG